MNAAHQLTLADVLEVENDSAFLDVKCESTGILLWSLIRTLYIRFVVSDLLYGESLSDLAVARTGRARMLRSFSRAGLYNASRPRRRRKVIVMPSGWGNALVEGKWLNRYGDYFAQARQADTVVIEEMTPGSWPFPRHVEDMFFHQPLRLAATATGRVIARLTPSTRARDLVQHAVARGKAILGWHPGQDRVDWLTRVLQQKAAALPALSRSYGRMLRSVAPELILVEEACYGGHITALITSARDMDITVAEYQHGAVTAGHDAYNVAPALAASADYRRLLPEYFLGYGTWWNEQISVPVKKLAIGNPHRSERGLPATNRSSAASDILVLGDGIDLDAYIELAASIARYVGDRYRVVFRPHPVERARVRDRYPDDNAGARVFIDRKADIYEAYATAKAVVSEVSTGLFEAIGLVERIFIWDTAKARFSIPSHLFQRFKTGEELGRLLADPSTGKLSEEQVESIWASHWKDNYQRFVASVVRA